MSNLAQDHPISSGTHTLTQRPDEFIDLTTESSPPPSRLLGSLSPLSHSEFLRLWESTETSPEPQANIPAMARQPSSDSQEPSRKRRRLDSVPSMQRRSGPSHLHRQPTRPLPSDNVIDLDDGRRSKTPTNVPADVLDLTDVNDTTDLRKVQDEQRRRHEEAQEQQNNLLKESVQAQEPEQKGPFKFGQLQCVICMDNMTNMTATQCGKHKILGTILCIFADRARASLLPRVHC